jgi:hypothetical protein
MMNILPTGPIPIPRYALSYGLRLDQGTGSEFVHPRVPIVLPNGSMGNMTLHVVNGTADEIKAQLLRSIDAFFDIYADVYADVSRSTSGE